MSVRPPSPPPPPPLRPADVQPPPAMERPPAAFAAPLLRNQTARPALPNAHRRGAQLAATPSACTQHTARAQCTHICGSAADTQQRTSGTHCASPCNHYCRARFCCSAVSTSVELLLVTILIAISMPELQRIVFAEVTAAIYVKTTIKGNRSTKRHATRGRGGTERISLWKEIISMIEDKGLAVRAPFFPPAPFEFLSRF